MKNSFDTIQFIAKNLPAWVHVGDVVFRFSLFINHDYDIRIGYLLESGGDEFGSWNNPYIRPGEDYYCSFLFLEENITSDVELRAALLRTRDFLTKVEFT
jgi:hypothetical protein